MPPDDPEGADAFELDALLRAAVAREQKLEAALAPLLLRVAEARLHRAAGFPSLERYARERLGVSPRKARALLRLARRARAVPQLGEAFATGRLSWVQAHTLVPVLVAAPGRAADWIAWAQRVSVRRLEEDVEAATALFESDPCTFETTAGNPQPDIPQAGIPQAGIPQAGIPQAGIPQAGIPQAGIPRNGSAPAASGLPAGRQAGAKPRESERHPQSEKSEKTQAIFWVGPSEAARFFGAVLCSVRRHLERRDGRLPSEGEALEAMLDHVLEVWSLRNGRRRAAHGVFERDGWRCTVPGCSSLRHLHDHHIVFRAAGGSDAPENRTTLCAWHHLRGVHTGLIRCCGRAPQGLRFDLGVRQGAPPLLAFGPGERLVAMETKAS